MLLSPSVREGSTNVFFRNDDVGRVNDELRALVDLLVGHGVPCHHQVVPTALDEQSAQYLRGLKQAHPELVFLDQHGLEHEQRIGGAVTYSEFGHKRCPLDQYDAIARGRELLSSRLGEAFGGDVFTPPCHAYDEMTLRAISRLGFRILSARVRFDPIARLYYRIGRMFGRAEWLGRPVSYHLGRTPNPEIAEVSVAVDAHFESNGSGRRVYKSTDQLWKEFQAARRHLDVVGIMTHHDACDTPEKLVALRGFVERLVDEPSVRLVDIHAVAPQPA